MAKANTPSSGRSKAPQSSDKDTASKEPTGSKPPKPDDSASESRAGKAGAAKTAAASAGKAETSKTEAAAKAEASEKDKSVGSEANDKEKAKPERAAPEPAKAAAAPATSAKAAPKPAEAKPGDGTPVTAKAEPDKPQEKPASTAKPAASASAATAPRPQPQPEPARRGSVFWPFVAGGVIAGVLGFAASEMNFLNTRVGTDAIVADVAAQADRITALETAEAPVPEAPDLSGIEAALADISQNIATIQGRLDALEARPVTTEGATTGLSPEGVAELAALQSSVEAQREEIERLIANAQSVEEATARAAKAAAAQAAITKIAAAISNGASFDPALEELEATGIVPVPEALDAVAADGVPSLLGLQTDFPDVARAALAAARAAGTDGGGEGVTAFLRRQLGARSVAPREGSDPDAVLSRAEAAVRQGRIADALSEIEALPPEATAAMEDWISRARSRAAAEIAVQEVSQSLTAN